MARSGGQSPEWERKVPEKSRTCSRFGLAVLLAFAGGPARAAAPEIHYAPAENLEPVDVAALGQARHTIDMAAYVLTDWPVIDALIAAAARGVVIRVYLDGEQSGRADMNPAHPFVRLMGARGVAMKNKDPDAPLMHLKSYCVDGHLLRTGSANFSASGLKAQDNDLVLIDDAKACAGFTAAFGRAWTGRDAQ